MDHIAIMKKSRELLPKILSGEKTIESRWYKSRRFPWNKIQKGERIYFKNSGEPVTLTADVEKILQFESLNPEMISAIIDKYGKTPGICLEDLSKSKRTLSEANYCILIFLKNIKKTTPFKIDKSGFGLMSAWIAVDSIEKIKKILN